MYLKKLELQNFRSYTTKRFLFAEDSTLVVGDNAAGKTNLLEAIWLVSVGRSFRAKLENQMIKEGGRNS